MTLALTQFRSRLVSGVAASPIHVLHIGDSVTESTGASATTLRYENQLDAALQTAYDPSGVAGGSGFVNTFHNGDPASGWSLGGGGAGTNSAGYLGFREHSYNPGETATFAFTGTSFSLHFTKGKAFVTLGEFTLTIDGGAPVTVTPAAGSQNLQGVYTSPTLMRGAHTLICTPSPGHRLYLAGIHVFDGDEHVGIHGWEAGHFGIKTSGYGGGQLADYCAMNNPALITMLLGLNDLCTGVTASSYSTSIQDIITSVRGYCAGSPSFLLLSPYARTDLTSQQQALVPEYANALAAIDDGDVDVDFYDLGANFVPTSAPAHMSDAVHPNDAGHATIASLIATQITGSTGPG